MKIDMEGWSRRVIERAGDRVVAAAERALEPPTHDIPMDGVELAGIRDEIGVSNGWLATRLRVSPASVARWLNGTYRRVPPPLADWLRRLEAWFRANPVPPA